MILGYILGIFLIPRYLKQDNALKISAILGLILTAGIVLSHGKLAIIFLASLGFANAIMWPAMWPLALEGLGKFTKIGSALLIMAIAGGAIIPLILAKLFDLLPGQTQFAYLIAIPCYAYILYYASMGHSIKSWSK
jgi:fucose permease